MYDLIIIGAGPAGLSAAIHAKRFNLNFVVLEKNAAGGQARAANLIENYPGFPEGISGHKLMERFVSHAGLLGIEIKQAEVKNIENRNREYVIKTGASTLLSKTIILATGLEPVRLPQQVSDTYRGDLYYYPVPQDVSHKEKRVLVIGGGDCAFDEAISFASEAAFVTVAMRSERPRALERLVKRAVGLKVDIKTGLSDEEIANIKADVVIACIGKIPPAPLLLRGESAIFPPFLKGDKGGLRTPNDERRTTFLIGDIAHPDIRHIATAVGDGVVAVEKVVHVIANSPPL